MKLLITGLAGVIGFAVAKRFSDQGHRIIGIDDLDDDYDALLKRAWVADLAGCANAHSNLVCHLNVLEGGTTVRPDSSSAPYALYNIGHGSPVALMYFIRAIEQASGAGSSAMSNPCSRVTCCVPGRIPSRSGCRPYSERKRKRQYGDSWRAWYRELYGL